MIETVKRTECTGCQMCGDICPVNAITYQECDGFWYPKADESTCIKCGLCIDRCPVLRQTKPGGDKTYPKVLAAWSSDEQERRFSTSGGVYFELAKKMLHDGGYIAGVQYTDNYKAAQFAIYHDEEGLKKIRNSKYFQANAEGIYKEVKKLLEAGEKVLFCGTPCQNAALESFIGKAYENLVQVDFICLAVNSPKAHKKYVEYLERIKKAPISYLHFKHKKNGWNRFGVYAEFENGKRYYRDRYTDLFVRGYVENHLFIRESCEDCHFRSERHSADITLGDFWGVKPNAKNPNLDYGTSVVLCNTEKGVHYVESVGDTLTFYEQSIEDVRGGNGALNNNATRNKNTIPFLRELEQTEFDTLMKKYARKRKIREKVSICKIYVIHFMKRIMGKIKC